MPDAIRISAPLTDECIEKLHAGDSVLLSGVIYTARDAAHKRLVELIQRGETPPIDLRGQVVYYAGPAPAKPGRVIGSIGPTTAGRMDAYAPILMAHGLKGMIGKGRRSPAVRQAINELKAVYFGATGGAAALLARCVKSAEIVAYEDLGTEAIRRLEVVDLPLIVINDMYGQDQYERGVAIYARI
jgi:fumarate hydratase subunit beta